MEDDYERNCVQCRYKLVSGRRCHNTTCDRFPYCWIHMKKEYGLVVKPSTIPNSGLGLFFVGYTDDDGNFVNKIKIGEIVTYYSTKRLLTKRQYDAKFSDDASYGFCLSKKVCLDGGPTDNYPGRLLNHKSTDRANVRWGGKVTKEGDRYLLPMYARKRIDVGRELFIDYGAEYWKGRPKG